MLIKPSTALRNEYNMISELCKEKQEPVFLTKNGEGDLVLMSIEAYKLDEALYRATALSYQAQAPPNHLDQKQKQSARES